MSGPKLSEAEIERLRQEQLERERLEALRRLREAQQAYNNACKQNALVKQYALNSLRDIDAIYASDARKEIESILVALVVQQISDDKDPQAYHLAAQAMLEACEKALNKIENCLKQYEQRSSVDQKISNRDMMYQSFNSFLDMTSDPVDIKNIDFSSNYDRQQLERKINQILQHYQWLSVSGNSNIEKQFAVKSLNKMKVFLSDSKNLARSRDVQLFIQAIINEEMDIQRRQKEMEDLYDDYLAITTLLDINPDPPTSFGDASMLRKQIAELHARYRKKDEMDYIADQINDTMLSLGYGFVSSSVLTRKDQSEMDCSLYQADAETGIAIYTDQSGAVMMRMTVLGNDTDITDADRDFSYQRQIDFCSGHPDIVAALAERGVYLKQKSYLEPDRKYTYKVNVGVSNATGQVTLKKHKVDRRKRRRANKKKVRAM